mgnify:CR=1 FL=1
MQKLHLSNDFSIKLDLNHEDQIKDAANDILKSNKSIVFEDSCPGLRSSIAAKLPTIFVPSNIPTVIDKDIEFGVYARGIIEDENGQGSEFADLDAANVNVRSHKGVTHDFHHKYMNYIQAHLYNQLNDKHFFLNVVLRFLLIK